MNRDLPVRLVRWLLYLCAAGVAWSVLMGPSGQVQSGATGALPVTPFFGFAAPFTDNVAEPLQYNGPGREAPDDAPAGDVRIGVIAQLTGPAAPYGVAMRRGVEFAFDEANATGGYEGRKFVAIARDDLFDMGANGNEMVKLVYDDEVRAIIGAVHSGNTHVGVRIALKCEVPQITSISTDPSITEVQIPWAFRCLADDRLQGRVIADEMFGRRGHRRVVLVNQQSRYGQMGIIEIRSIARRLGVETLLQVRFLTGQKDFGELAAKIARAEPEAIVIWGLFYEAAGLVKALRAAGVKAEIFGGDGLVSPAFIERAGEAAEGVVVTYPFDAQRDDPVCRDFVERYKTRYGEEPDSFVAHGYDAARIVIESVKKAGLNRARIRDAMAATKDFPGATGKITFDGTGNLVGQVHLAVVRAGRFVKLGREAGAGEQ